MDLYACSGKGNWNKKYRCCFRGERKTAGGFIWKYKEKK